MASTSKARRVVILAFPGVQPLDVIGPAEVFAGADALSGGDAYSVEVVARDASPIAVRGGGYSLLPKLTTAGCRGPIDTLVVAGGVGVREAERDVGLIRWIRSAARRSRRVTSVCSGSFSPAPAFWREIRSTTHWVSSEELARRYPELRWTRPDLVRDGDVWTSAGVTAGMDLSFALVAADLGGEVAVEVARWLVLFLQRPGGQAQFSSHLSARSPTAGLRELQLWIADHLDADLRVESSPSALHEPAEFRPRLLTRDRRDPAAYVEPLRVEQARQRLEDSADPLDRISPNCGFGTPETMRRAFSRRVGVPPAEYRARVRRAPDAVDTAAPRGETDARSPTVL